MNILSAVKSSPEFQIDSSIPEIVSMEWHGGPSREIIDTTIFHGMSNERERGQIIAGVAKAIASHEFNVLILDLDVATLGGDIDEALGVPEAAEPGFIEYYEQYFDAARPGEESEAADLPALANVIKTVQPVDLDRAGRDGIALLSTADRVSSLHAYKVANSGIFENVCSYIDRSTEDENKDPELNRQITFVHNFWHSIIGTF